MATYTLNFVDERPSINVQLTEYTINEQIPGIQGAAGPGILVKGEVSSIEALPEAEVNDGYFIGENLYVYSGDEWINAGLVKGADGAPGPKGDTGEMGPIGPAGEQGPAGPEGPAGPKGDKGVKGDKGDIGADGPEGPVGETGPRGPQGLSGPKGDKGDTGSTGPRGLTGPKGSKGDAGPKGDIGPQGIEGPEGPKGPMGLRGPEGAIGPEGPEGPQGPQGLTGPKGDKGEDSTVPGPEGPEGPRGPLGLTGPRGLDGPEGPRGPRGFRGLEGPEGPIGKDGARFIFSDTQPSIDDMTPGIDLWIRNNPSSSGHGSVYQVSSGIYGYYWEKIGDLRGATGARGPWIHLGNDTPSNPRLGDIWIKDSGAAQRWSSGIYGNYWDSLGNWRGPEGPEGPVGPEGPEGKGVTILGSFDTVEELETAHPTGEPGDGYLVSGDLYVWADETDTWKNVGTIQGPQGPQGLQGIEGEQGPQGPQGPIGETGPEGESAYQTAVDNGFVGTETEWLESLVGPEGPTGPEGPQGPEGPEGPEGPQGIQGVEGPEGPQGPIGETGDTAYEVAVSEGFVGTEQEWLDSLVGPEGPQGIQGPEGPQGIQGETGPEGPIGPEGPEGPAGADGSDGADGVGVPVGGAEGQVLAKTTATDHDTEWIDPPSGGGGGDGFVWATKTVDYRWDVHGDQYADPELTMPVVSGEKYAIRVEMYVSPLPDNYLPDSRFSFLGPVDGYTVRNMTNSTSTSKKLNELHTMNGEDWGTFYQFDGMVTATDDGDITVYFDLYSGREAVVSAGSRLGLRKLST